MPRLVYLAGLTLVVLAGAFRLTDSLLAGPPAVTEANVGRIKEGMTLGRVEAILGRLAPDERAPRWHLDGRLGGARYWPARAGGALVNFDEDDRVQWVLWLPPMAPDPPEGLP